MNHYAKAMFVLLFLLGIGTTARTWATEPITRTTPTTIPANSPSPSTECWPVTQNPKRIRGSFVYQDRAKERAFSWDLSTFQTLPITDFSENLQNSFPFSVSLDGSTLAGLSDNNKIVLITQHQIQSFQLPAGIYGHMVYLSDGRIRIPMYMDTRESLENADPKNVGLREKYYLLDPVTGTISFHSVRLPNFIVGPHGLFSIQYSPDMHYVVYLTGYDHYDPRFTLFDFHQKEIVWSGPDLPEGMRSDPARMPVWRPDSSALVYSFITEEEKYGNYYLISLDGKLTQLTQFTQTEMMGSNTGPIANPSWSPDGRYLAFKAGQGATGPIRLYLWDTQQKVALLPCLPDEGQIDVGYLGHWSYDGTYLLITLGYPNREYPDEGPNYLRFNTVILDMANRTIVELPDQEHRGEYTTFYGKDQNGLLGWVNWEIP